MKTSLRALLLDFDGVLADSEPIHLCLFQEVLREEGIGLTRQEYYERYLGLDDRGVFEAVFRSLGRPLASGREAELVAKKNQAMLNQVKGHLLLMPGAADFVERASKRYFLAVVSGALKSEIQAILASAGLLSKFQVIVAADDVEACKPAPDAFQAAIHLLNRDCVPEAEILLPQECLAIEDSPWGVEAAHKAGVKCVALLTSYPRERLGEADLIATDLKSLSLPSLEHLVSR